MAEPIQRHLPVFGGVHGESLLDEDLGKRLANGEVVVDQEHRWWAGAFHRGNVVMESGNALIVASKCAAAPRCRSSCAVRANHYLGRDAGARSPSPTGRPHR